MILKVLCIFSCLAILMSVFASVSFAGNIQDHNMEHPSTQESVMGARNAQSSSDNAYSTPLLLTVLLVIILLGALVFILRAVR